MIKKYLGQGQIGDLIHSLCLCKYNYIKYGIKADLYLHDNPNPFYTGLEKTYNELKPILHLQEWVNSFKIYNGEHIDVDLSSFRSSPLLFKTNWLELIIKMYEPNDIIPKEFSWIDMPKDSIYSEYVLINRSLKVPNMSQDTINNYKKIIKEFDNVYFICTDIEQYNNFPLREECELLKSDTLYDFFLKINSCKLYIGNQSGPSAWATALNVNRIIELRNGSDAYHYIKDEEYYSNFKWFKGD